LIISYMTPPLAEFRLAFLYNPCITVRGGVAILHTNWLSPSAEREEMEHKRILELALEALQNQKAQVEAEIEALRAEMRGSVRATSTRRAVPTAGPKGKRRAKTPAEREAQSKRMKAYWAAKKAAVATKAKKATHSRPKARSKSAE
jgi:hypothetical protein